MNILRIQKDSQYIKLFGDEPHSAKVIAAKSLAHIIYFSTRLIEHSLVLILNNDEIQLDENGDNVNHNQTRKLLVKMPNSQVVSLTLVICDVKMANLKRNQLNSGIVEKLLSQSYYFLPKSELSKLGLKLLDIIRIAYSPNNDTDEIMKFLNSLLSNLES